MGGGDSSFETFLFLCGSKDMSLRRGLATWIWLGREGHVWLSTADAGWSSSVARWAHNPEVTGSNPVPATIRKPLLTR